MTITVNEVNYDVVGFDTYTDEYSKVAKLDFQNDGEQELVNELECYTDGANLVDGEDMSVTMPEEKSADGKTYSFRFGVTFEDGVCILSYYGNWAIG